MWQVVGILAGLERSLRQERTKAGRATAQAWGVKTGRKPLQTTQQVAYTHKLVRQGESLVMFSNSRDSQKSPIRLYHPLGPTTCGLPLLGFRDVFLRLSRSEPG